MEPLAVSKGIFIVDVGLYLSGCRTLVLSDLHLGFESAMIDSGVLVPKGDISCVLKRISGIMDSCPHPVEAVVLNGDLKHGFSRASGPEWSDSIKVFDFIARKCARIIIVKGNHDRFIAPVAAKRGIPVVDEFRCGDILVLHGDSVRSVAGCVTVVIGHEHPAIALREGSRVERFKCFLKGRYRGKALLVMPSFLPATEGTDVSAKARMSPFLGQDLSGFEVFVVEDKVYRFGKLARHA